LGNHVSSCAIVDSPCNFSDHRPVLVNISSSAGFDLDRLPHRTNHFESPCTASISNKLAFIWDVNNFSKYYDCTRSQFAELSRLFAAYDFNQLALLRPDFFSSRGANTLYKNVIHSLLNCSLECFKVKSNGARGKQNWWWDNSLKVAKAASCSSFNAWQLSGSIADSPEHQVYLAARRKLKKLIHSKKRDANQSLNENLFCSLNSCNTQKFWRLWNANFKTNNGRSIYSFEDAHSDPDIANLLANSHKKNCSPSNEFLNNKRKLEFSDKKSNYVSSGFFQPIVLTATQIEKAISDISNNTAPGHDSICIEHLKLAHPSVFLILAVIFNIFLYLGEVPCDFGLGIVSPIPKFKGHKRKVSPDDFRGITLNVIPSKIFEHAIAYFLRPLATSDRQFGFKVGSGCNYAINTVKNTINFFNKRGSRPTVNVCCLDIKKAFDRANWWGILLMLQRKNINPQIINVIEHWFMISSAQVRWNGCLSDPISLAAGVRQGGVLSPLIFSAFIDDLLHMLKKSNLGCFIKGNCLNSFLYADDLILLSISLSDLQSLVNCCITVLDDLDFQINSVKSVCLRIGPRFRSPCLPVMVGNQPLIWADEFTYLGVVFKGGKKLTFNWKLARGSFYKAVNSIFGTLGSNPNISVLISLARSRCIPILSYGIESLSLTNSDISTFSFAYNCIFFKLFHCKDPGVILNCQFYCSVLPFQALYDYLRYNFLLSVFGYNLFSVNNPFYEDDYKDFAAIAAKYHFSAIDSRCNIKHKIWSFIESSL